MMLWQSRCPADPNLPFPKESTFLVCEHAFEMKTNQTKIHTLLLLPFPRLLQSRALSSCPKSPRTRQWTAREEPRACPNYVILKLLSFLPFCTHSSPHKPQQRLATALSSLFCLLIGSDSSSYCTAWCGMKYTLLWETVSNKRPLNGSHLLTHRLTTPG